MASRGFMQAFSVKTDLKRFYRKQETSPKSWKDFFQLFLIYGWSVFLEN